MNEAYLFLKKGGLVMIPIALCSVIALTLFLERLWALQRQKVLPESFINMLKRALREGRMERARSLADSHESTIARVARAGLRYLGQRRAVVRDAMQEAGRRETAFLERFVGAIGAVASVAPLIGLLGTVTGMIKVFGRVGEEYEKGGELNPGMLANGIWEALITTAAGLTVAIPAFLAYRYLMSRIDRYVVELEAEASEIVDLVAPHDERPTEPDVLDVADSSEADASEDGDGMRERTRDSGPELRAAGAQPATATGQETA